LPNNQNLDWIKLQNSGGGTVTISSGAQTVRKFYTQQPLNITGGSLSVSYVPGSGGQFDMPSEFNAAVTLSSGAAYSAHTTQVDGGGGTFNANGGTVTFTDILLASHASNSGKMVMGGDVTFAQTNGAGTSVIRSTGSLAQAGSVSLSAGDRTLTVNNGSAGVDLQVRAAITGAGRLVKSGAGTMQLSSATNSYSGGTTISAGTLQLTADNQLGAAPGSFQSNNIVLDGGTLRTGARINSISLTNAGTNYASFPTLFLNGFGSDALTASANVLAGVRTIAVTAGGSGYVNQSPSAPPIANTAGTFVDIVGGGGTGATAYATVSGGVVTSITVANAGSGYTSMPTINISSTLPTGSTAAGAGATANISGITLQSIALTDGGFDYTTPTIVLSGGGGTGATATAASTPTLTLNSNRGVSLTANGGTLYQTTGTTLTIGGIISSTGSGTFNKSGGGTLIVNGAGTYTGATAINKGTLQIGSAERIPDSSAVTMSSGSTFDLQNNNETIGSLAGTGNVSNIGLLDVGGDNTSTAFSGTISGNSLRKSGSGKLALFGSNSYSGGTTISGGTLSTDSITNAGVNSGFGTGNITITNGATLEYTGFTAGPNRPISLGSGGGVISVSTSSSLSLFGVVDGTALTKSGSGTLTVRSASTYTGGTTVSAGSLFVTSAAAKLGTGDVTVEGTTASTFLVISSSVTNAIDDSATLYLMGGGSPDEADQGYVSLSLGVNERVGALFLGGVLQASGLTYGSTSSSALIQSDEYFTSGGLVSVGLLGDFNNDHSVDAADYVVWQKSPITYGGSPGYDLWRANFGNTSPAAGSGSSLDGAMIPEPSSLALLMLGVVALVGRHRVG
jgi:fibronectin-binding autotransporter adhesin